MPSKPRHRGVVPRKTDRAYVMVRCIQEAQHRLVDLSRATGKTMTELVGLAIEQYCPDGLSETE